MSRHALRDVLSFVCYPRARTKHTLSTLGRRVQHCTVFVSAAPRLRAFPGRPVERSGFAGETIPQEPSFSKRCRTGPLDGEPMTR